MIATANQKLVYVIATILMAAGLIRVWVRPLDHASSVFVVCCFMIASALLALFVLWMWRTRREGVRLYWIFWVVGFQEVVCIQEFSNLLSHLPKP